ncbi:hypothetical protein Bccel_3478 [Pseudobacteroides cellulosolvens ATCC 35603 = DSM 2933]|uniref:Uncharacterized protein n=1 Tax=Pseudobacteroides cellulosolvens ATCC 35603 = DSM 2933 TaxID=398512 RepID=A0A0L6JR00_9FIRM|nr:hypothetical protein [Pseudobacteroides cellulosolvens]KNY28204.1 hypothetical protein Bccel_3478 [Pseudobacteroides cellulosolvens ATCC 35603 = DSM 2933]
MEVLIYTALLGIILPVMSSILLYGFDTYKSNYNYIRQEDMVSNVSNLLRKDIEASKIIKIISDKELQLTFPDGKSKTWKFGSDNTLKVGTTIVAKDIDSSSCKFEKRVPSAPTPNWENKILVDEGYVVLTIKPIETNSKKFTNRNFSKPIITEFSVRYKEIQ